MSSLTTHPCLSCGRLLMGSGIRCVSCQRHREREREQRPTRAYYRDPAYRALPIGGQCWLCGEWGSDTRDHVVCLRHGGTNVSSNIRPAHRSCNSARICQGQCVTL